MSEYTKEYRIAQLLAKEMIGKLSPEEQQELEEWKNEASTTTALHEQILNPENKRKRDEFTKDLNLESSWQKVEKRVISFHEHKSQNFRWRLGAAAAIILFATTGLLLPHTDNIERQTLPVATIRTGSSKAVLINPEGKEFYLSNQDFIKTIDLGNGLKAINDGHTVKYMGTVDSSRNDHKFNVIQVPKGGEFELVLSDGTHVWLNSDSKLSFPVRFDATKREVTLTGEAYFSVTRNEASPFTVKTTNGIAIRVLGTQFNIQAYPEGQTVETTLCQGSVSVSDGKQKITLSPAQQAVYVKATQGLTSRDVNIRLYTAWKDGLFVFENKPLEEIMQTLSRWYDINIFYANPIVKKYHFTGDLERYGDFRKTLNMIEKATSIRFRVNGNNVTVEDATKQTSKKGY